MTVNRRSTRKQLRGKALLARIEAVIKELAHQVQKNGKEYIYNATKIAELVPTTRKTLLKHDEFVEGVIADLSARRRMRTGEATFEFLRDQIESLREKIAEKEHIINQLRSHHVEIFEQLHAYSVRGEALIRPILEDESLEAGYCILCGSERAPEDPKKNNVVPLKGKKNG